MRGKRLPHRGGGYAANGVISRKASPVPPRRASSFSYPDWRFNQNSAVVPKKRPSRKKRTVNDFSRYCGGWSQKEYEKFEAAVADCERIDAEAWK